MAAKPLLFSEQALADLQRFVRYYEEAFFELYRDSGVWNEELIIQNYRESARALYLAILHEIEKRLAQWKVLGRKTTTQQKELCFYVGDRLVIVRYIDNRRRRVRVVASIAIDRKPIIF